MGKRTEELLARFSVAFEAASRHLTDDDEIIDGGHQAMVCQTPEGVSFCAICLYNIAPVTLYMYMQQAKERWSWS
jgi:hypothetical protein